jgi:hypothetical protein
MGDPLLNKCELNQSRREAKILLPRAGPLSRSVGRIDWATGREGGARGPAPPAGNPNSDAIDLVGRALAILAEETAAWEARQPAKSTPGSSR